MPYFLFLGAHVLHDLPEEIAEAKKRYPGLVMEMGGTWGRTASWQRSKPDGSARHSKGWGGTDGLTEHET